MPDDIFRIAIVVGVGLACLAFIVQAGVAVALFRRIGKIHASAAPALDQARAVLQKAEPMVDRLTVVLEKAAPAMEKTGPFLQKADAAVDEIKSILANANRVIDEVRPQVIQLSGEAVEIARTVHEYVDKLGSVLLDASHRAQDRLAQIDHSVESTVQQVEQMSDSMKRAVMRPVREING